MGNSIAISGTDVHIAGFNGSDAVYWLNGRMITLPKALNGSAIANGIAVLR
jgi:hypothetical protein